MRRPISLKQEVFIISSVVLVIALLIAFLIIRAQHNEKTSKQFLGETLSSLPIPETCTEKSRDYQVGGVDTVSTWYADLECDTSGGTA